MPAALVLSLSLFVLGCAPEPPRSAPQLDTGGLLAAPTPATDADGDGYVASDDCDDHDPDIHPLQPERCGDGEDDNCNGLADEGCPDDEDDDTDDAEYDDTGAREDTGDFGWDVDEERYFPGALVITELMINPVQLRDPDGEWLEVLNASSEPLPLSGLVIAVDGVERHVLSGPPSLAPGVLAVVGVGAPALDEEAGGLRLLNEGGEVTLWAGAVQVDRVRWSAADVPSGASWSLDPLAWGDAERNDDALWWCAAETRWAERADRGSPGAVSAGCPQHDHDGDGWSRDQGDCDDDDGSIWPEAEEIWYDGVDQNCDGADDYDQDGDGFDWLSDCDDADAAVRPDAAEVCNGLDDDCDGRIDADAEDAAWWFADADADGYGDAGSAVWACAAPSGHLADSTDCDDTDDSAHPGGAEVCGNDVDEDCVDGAAACDEVSYAVGGTGSSWTTSGYYRGNLYEADEDGTLVRYTVTLDLPAAGCDVDFAVYSASSASGSWTLEWSGTARGAGSGAVSSGIIDLETSRGAVYSLGAGWRCKATYYAEMGSGLLGEDGGIGAFAGSHYDNSYSGMSGGSFVPAYVGAGSVLYAQTVYMER